ncbi:ribosome maturation factor RimM [Idiomarina tyrosinivorans]|uniref:Ribosome maturation factor RimM n=1 Tax=Idiomarina tyrosinivorans TaxID=1445662 RepID=A0A432ZLP1_9GAMM|nr:ribosome maturation factor RimM [Idiomarina tyrosinivorans]RUO78869.1 ribosome maturation factor RimM [Idiomarina tyrosinivorans]
MAESQDTVVIGRFGAVYGVKGWLRIQSFTEHAEAIFDYRPWLVGRTAKAMQVAEWRFHGKSIIARVEGIEDRDEAAKLTGQDIVVDAQVLPELSEDEFYWRDLIGLQVLNTDGYDMGVVEQIMPTASNDVLVVKANARDAFGKNERLIPFVQSEYIVSVDTEAKQITVDWPSDF